MKCPQSAMRCRSRRLALPYHYNQCLYIVRPHNNNERNHRPSLNQKANKILRRPNSKTPLLQCRAQAAPREPMTSRHRLDSHADRQTTTTRTRRVQCNNAQVIRMPFFANFVCRKVGRECKNPKPKQKQSPELETEPRTRTRTRTRSHNQNRAKQKAKRNVTKRISLN